MQPVLRLMIRNGRQSGADTESARALAGQAKGVCANTQETRNRPQRRRLARRQRQGVSCRPWRPCRAADVLEQLLERMGARREQALLHSLWRDWAAALGPGLAPLALPLGHRGQTLLIGAEDAMILQELQLQGPEILAAVNAFLHSDYFTDVRVSLVLDHTILGTSDARPDGHDTPAMAASADSRAAAAACAGDDGGGGAARGIYLDTMDQNSPVARCYARYARQRGTAARRGPEKG